MQYTTLTATEVGSPLKVETLSTRVYKRLLAMIMAGEFAPGHPLREADLAKILGVSRTPVREAVFRLCEFGILEVRPNRGAMVRRIGTTELVHIFEIREALEGMAAELACGRLTAADFARLDEVTPTESEENSPTFFEACRKLEFELHHRMASASGNPILADYISRLLMFVLLFQDPRASQFARIRETRREHLEIIAQLKRGDPAASRQAMIDHIRVSRDFTLGLSTDTAKNGDTKPTS